MFWIHLYRVSYSIARKDICNCYKLLYNHTWLKLMSIWFWFKFHVYFYYYNFTYTHIDSSYFLDIIVLNIFVLFVL